MPPKELRETLLMLAGYQSGLFRSPHADEPWQLDRAYAKQAGLTIGEAGLYDRLGALAYDHWQLRRNLERCRQSEGCVSTIVHAAASVARKHAHGWLDLLVDIERRTIDKDPELVAGGDEAVSLTRIVAELELWARPLRHLRSVSTMLAAVGRDDEVTTKMVLDRLRSDTRTGYNSLVEVNLKMSEAAQEAWRLSLRNWVLYGQLNTRFLPDFFVQPAKSGGNSYVVDPTLVPEFCPPETAKVICEIGETLCRLHQDAPAGQLARRELHCARRHGRWLRTLEIPIDPRMLTKMVRRIRRSLSSTVLRSVLPATGAARLLDMLADRYLLRDGDFARALCERVDSDFRRPGSASDGQNLRDATVNAVLHRTLQQQRLASEQELRDERFGDLDVASLNPRMQLADDKRRVLFDDLVFGVPVRMVLPLTWPISLLLTEADVAAYDACFHLLLALRRAQGQLDDLWRSRRSDAAIAKAGNAAQQLIPARIWLAAHATRHFLDTLSAHLHRHAVHRFTRAAQLACIDPDPIDDQLDDNSEEAVVAEYASALREEAKPSDDPALWDDDDGDDDNEQSDGAENDAAATDGTAGDIDMIIETIDRLDLDGRYRRPQSAGNHPSNTQSQATGRPLSSLQSQSSGLGIRRYGPAQVGRHHRLLLRRLRHDLLLDNGAFCTSLAKLVTQVDVLVAAVQSARRRASVRALQVQDDLAALGAVQQQSDGVLAAAEDDAETREIHRRLFLAADNTGVLRKACVASLGSERDVDALLLALDASGGGEIGGEHGEQRSDDDEPFEL